MIFVLVFLHFNAIMCMPIFPISLSTFFMCGLCMYVYVCMYVSWTQDIFKGFYKLFTNKKHTFSIFPLQLDRRPFVSFFYFHFAFVSEHAVSSPYQTSTFTRIHFCFCFHLVATRSIFRVFKIASICFIIMEQKKKTVEESPKTRTKR